MKTKLKFFITLILLSIPTLVFSQPINTTWSGLLSIISANNVQNTTYRITDIEAGAYVQGIDSNRINYVAQVYLYTPKYDITATRKGQLLPTSTVAVNQKWVWGNRVWRSITGTNPAPLNDYELNPSNWTLISPDTSADYYITIAQGSIDVDNALLFSSIQQGTYNNRISSFVFPAVNLFAITQWANPTINLYDNTGFILNNRLIGGSVNCSMFQNICYGYSASFNDVGIKQNILNNDGQIGLNKISNSRIKNNQIISNTGASGTGTVPQIGFCVLNDNCSINNNIISGNGACIWDVDALENSSVSYNVLSGNELIDEYPCLIADIIQTQHDKVDSNELSATDTRIEAITQMGYSSISNVILAEQGARVKLIQMSHSRITNVNIGSGSGKTGITDVVMYSSMIKNVTNINISNSTFNNIKLDLTGWTVDINNEKLENGVGSFSFEHNFATNPMNAGDTVLYNYLPTGARITNIVMQGQGFSLKSCASITCGLQNGDRNLITYANISELNTQAKYYHSLSLPATSQCSLLMKINGANVTTGKVKITVKFIY